MYFYTESISFYPFTNISQNPFLFYPVLFIFTPVKIKVSFKFSKINEKDVREGLFTESSDP